MKIKIPFGRLVQLLAKTIRFSRKGFTREEGAELALDLLEIGGDILEQVDGDDRQERVFQRNARTGHVQTPHRMS